MLPGVYPAYKKDGSKYYRASITYCSKHISLGSFSCEEKAHLAYLMAQEILLEANRLGINDYTLSSPLSFIKWVILVNFRDNRIYLKNPIYLKSKYFIYYIDHNLSLKFDVDDLFYYAHHKIVKRGGHMFVSDYGLQQNLQTRYGIKSYAVEGRDYTFINGDNTDYRYSNIKVINPYYGVLKIFKNGLPLYKAKININGDYVIGSYESEKEAAIAYNKAANLLMDKGCEKAYLLNYIDGLNTTEYDEIYARVRLSKNLMRYIQALAK